MNRHFRFLGAKAFKRNLKGYTDNHNHTHKIPHICTIKVKQQGKKVVVKNNLELKVKIFYFKLKKMKVLIREIVNCSSYGCSKICSTKNRISSTPLFWQLLKFLSSCTFLNNYSKTTHGRLFQFEKSQISLSSLSSSSWPPFANKR